MIIKTAQNRLINGPGLEMQELKVAAGKGPPPPPLPSHASQIAHIHLNRWVTGERRSVLLASVEVAFQIYPAAVKKPDPQHACSRAA